MHLRFLSLVIATLSFAMPAFGSEQTIDLGDRRELFVDELLIDSMKGTELRLHRPIDEGKVIAFDNPWEGLFCGYCTVIKDGDLYRCYYRGNPKPGADGDNDEVYCYAESKDGKTWVKPNLGIYEIDGTKENNVCLANSAPLTHNFSPFLDTNPEVAADQRYKAVGGTRRSGLVAFVSKDGLHWKKLRNEPLITDGAFDSQNVVFWSPIEKKYLCYLRVFKGGIRRIARCESQDFVNWTSPVLMEYTHRGGKAPIEHLYTNQTHPYFRAPHIYMAIAARFMPGRQVLTDEQAKAINVNPGYFKDTSDAIFMTTRGGHTYQRTFLSGVVRGGIGAENWVSRTNYPALNVVQTGPHEMSLYVNQNYAQPTAHLRRYSIRLDGFSSLHAPYSGGTLTTKPITFDGKQLSINFSTSAAGGIRFGLLDAEGNPIKGFGVGDCREQIGNETDRVVTWKSGSDLSSLSGKTVRLQIEMKDADLYSFQFQK